MEQVRDVVQTPRGAAQAGGTVRLFGVDPWRNPAPYSRVGYVSEGRNSRLDDWPRVCPTLAGCMVSPVMRQGLVLTTSLIS